MYEIGVNSGNECGANIDEIYTNIKKAGFNNVMVAMKLGNYEESISKAIKHGLKIPFIHLNNRYASDLWAKGQSNINYVEDVKTQLELCAKYKIPIAVMHATVGNAGELPLPPNQHGVDTMNKILKIAQKLKVKIALENLDKPSYKNFCYLLDNINSKWLGLCYDAGHHNCYNPKTDILKKYGDRIIAIHLHDNLMDWTYGYDYSRDLHLLPFDGKINYNKIIKKLAKTKYNNVIMLEIHKNTCANPKPYTDMPIMEYLNLAKERAIKLANMLENEKKKVK